VVIRVDVLLWAELVVEAITLLSAELIREEGDIRQGIR
jgi:hypothetical protein